MKATLSRGGRNISLAALVTLAFLLGLGCWRISAVHASPPGTWTEIGSLLLGRSEFQAALLANGHVLVAGGYYGEFPTAEAELYNPSTGTWSGTGSMNTKRENYALAVLTNGEVLIAGGATAERFLGVTNTAEIYNPATGSFTRTGPMNVARQGATATLLSNGKVLVAGGSKFINGDAIASAELFDPSTGAWTLTGTMNVARSQHICYVVGGERPRAGGRWRRRVPVLHEYRRTV